MATWYRVFRSGLAELAGRDMPAATLMLLVADRAARTAQSDLRPGEALIPSPPPGMTPDQYRGARKRLRAAGLLDWRPAGSRAAGLIFRLLPASAKLLDINLPLVGTGGASPDAARHQPVCGPNEKPIGTPDAEPDAQIQEIKTGQGLSGVAQECQPGCKAGCQPEWETATSPDAARHQPGCQNSEPGCPPPENRCPVCLTKSEDTPTSPDEISPKKKNKEEENTHTNVCVSLPLIPREIAGEYISLKAAENGALSAYLWRAWRNGELHIGDLAKLRAAAAARVRQTVEESPFARARREEAERQAREARRREEEAEAERQARADWAALTPAQRAVVAQELGWDLSNLPLQSPSHRQKLRRFIATA